MVDDLNGHSVDGIGLVSNKVPGLIAVNSDKGYLSKNKKKTNFTKRVPLVMAKHTIDKIIYPV